MEYYSVIKKNELFAATWMDLEIIILSEVSQKEKEISYVITYTWNLKYGTNELIYEAETESQTERTDLWLLQERVCGEGMNWELGVSR